MRWNPWYDRIAIVNFGSLRATKPNLKWKEVWEMDEMEQMEQIRRRILPLGAVIVWMVPGNINGFIIEPLCLTNPANATIEIKIHKIANIERKEKRQRNWLAKVIGVNGWREKNIHGALNGEMVLLCFTYWTAKQQSSISQNLPVLVLSQSHARSCKLYRPPLPQSGTISNWVETATAPEAPLRRMYRNSYMPECVNGGLGGEITWASETFEFWNAKRKMMTWTWASGNGQGKSLRWNIACAGKCNWTQGSNNWLISVHHLIQSHIITCWNKIKKGGKKVVNRKFAKLHHGWMWHFAASENFVSVFQSVLMVLMKINCDWELRWALAYYIFALIIAHLFFKKNFEMKNLCENFIVFILLLFFQLFLCETRSNS
jgi:hypothetical protein